MSVTDLHSDILQTGVIDSLQAGERVKPKE